MDNKKIGLFIASLRKEIGLTQKELSDKLIFVEIINTVDSVVQGERVEKIYCFIYYDESTGALLFGRFSENSERDYVISLAKSIEVVKKEC